MLGAAMRRAQAIAPRWQMLVTQGIATATPEAMWASTHDLADGLIDGNRRALSRAITLSEKNDPRLPAGAMGRMRRRFLSCDAHLVPVSTGLMNVQSNQLARITVGRRSCFLTWFWKHEEVQTRQNRLIRATWRI